MTRARQMRIDMRGLAGASEMTHHMIKVALYRPILVGGCVYHWYHPIFWGTNSTMS